jgi:bifunctional DNA-binding transcriptional regulator/antitoxin component of YhaV-PrlF toxin-antitoxin module
MKSTGDVRVSQRGQMSLPAEARHRWGLDGGGEVGYLDVGEAVILIPGGVDNLRQRLFEALTEEDWIHARDGHGDPDLANE